MERLTCPSPTSVRRNKTSYVALCRPVINRPPSACRAASVCGVVQQVSGMRVQPVWGDEGSDGGGGGCKTDYGDLVFLTPPKYVWFDAIPACGITREGISGTCGIFRSRLAIGLNEACQRLVLF